MNIEPADINPIRRNQKKFDKRLHKFVKLASFTRVYDTQTCVFDGSFKKHDPNKLNLRNIVIGRLDDGWLHGADLAQIRAGQRGWKTSWARHPETVTNTLDITDWFWDEYLAKGQEIFK